ncbi:threonine aldolase [Mesotoga sp. Brook.08.YT.4.2.5.1]|uniref:low-specificity L-threonine aldolase n=1 Tax=unclassified Mesotoga TaxID=1184398 RepID=UPI000C18B358|nr:MULTISPECIES: low-specificity L-threonine aldolase [unclassified Mesotoga]PNE20118.1 threonine aldolase [Mesotoga sp. Brook.08.YT.4.2.5.1]PNS38229.1 threonine aldolase [Mesotoga sp. B105.6.4]PVD16951.1 threonine aldolase [Mesotoga sp. Brook.08.105.5.1]RAO97394.1 threonine aldolase [Mesotoga sp. Brook.08.YT.4.2.5.4.]RDI91655.1 threonine aldolase [Mesotoga sp. Brook.08.YT.4.2.5.2.]
MKLIDIRSDTVTVPGEEMRRMMANAEVGDDVYGDDPTVNKLEEIAASILKKEASLFVPSGTFGNQLSILTHTLRGDEVIIPASNHIIVHEAGASAVIAGVQMRTLDCDDGMPSVERIRKAIRSEDLHYPRTGLICLENAHSSGITLPLKYMSEVYELARARNVPLHLDGARIFNAAIASGVSPAEIAANSDSVMFCLSKGLGAPIGSMLAGTKEFIAKARKGRKIMGGAMRQVGIIAAAGIYALEGMTDRLSIDHCNAKYLAEGLSKIPNVDVFNERLDINMVFFRITKKVSSQPIVATLLDKGIKINPPEGGEWRFVTNLNVSRDDIDRVLTEFESALNTALAN